MGVVAACGDSDEPPASTPRPINHDNNDGNEKNGEDGNDEGSDGPKTDSPGAQLAAKYGLPQTPLSDAPPVEFTFFSLYLDAEPAANNPFIEIIEIITNTKINFVFYPGDLEYAVEVMLAAGDLPDIIYVGDMVENAIDSGHVMPIDELIYYHAPNLRAHFEPWWDLMKSNDGHIYTAEIYGTPVGKQNIIEHRNSAFWLQKSVLDHFGSAPESLDEYFNYIEEYMELYPIIDEEEKTKGFNIFVDEMFGFQLEDPPMFMQGNANWGDAINAGGGQPDAIGGARDRWTNEWNKAYYEFLNDAFQRKLININAFTQTEEEYLEEIASGAVLGFFSQKWHFDSAVSALIEEGKYERTYLPLDLTFPGIVPDYFETRFFTGGNGINISYNNPDPIRCVQYMDYLIQEDVQRFLRRGIEGEQWVFNDSGRMERLPEQRKQQENHKWTIDNLGYILYEIFPKMQGSYSDGNATSPDESLEEYIAGINHYDRALFDKLGIQTQSGLMKSEMPEGRPPYFPFWAMKIPYISPEPADVNKRTIKEVNEKYLYQLVTCRANRFESIWEEYVDAMSETGYEGLLHAIDREIERIMAVS